MQGGHPPHNCREAFTREGDQVYNNRYYSSDQHRALYLSRDVEEDIRYKSHDLRNSWCTETLICFLLLAIRFSLCSCIFAVNLLGCFLSF